MKSIENQLTSIQSSFLSQLKSIESKLKSIEINWNSIETKLLSIQTLSYQKIFWRFKKANQLTVEWFKLKSLLKLIILRSPDIKETWYPRNFDIKEYTHIVLGAGPYTNQRPTLLFICCSVVSGIWFFHVSRLSQSLHWFEAWHHISQDPGIQPQKPRQTRIAPHFYQFPTHADPQTQSERSSCSTTRRRRCVPDLVDIFGRASVHSSKLWANFITFAILCHLSSVLNSWSSQVFRLLRHEHPCFDAEPLMLLFGTFLFMIHPQTRRWSKNLSLPSKP